MLFGITEAPAAEARGPLSLWDHRGPHRWGEGASFALGSPRTPPLWRGGLFRSGITEARAAEARGPPSLWDHRGPAAEARGPLSLWDHGGPLRRREGASPAMGPPRPPPLRRGGLLGFGTTGAPAAEARGPPSLCDHRGLGR